MQHVNCECAKYIDHPSQARPGIHVFPDRLYVVTALSNPLRWRSRYWNYAAFEHHIETSGAILHTAELAYGDRHFEVTEPGNPRHLQLRTRHELWHKENLLNLAIQRLPPEARYVAWIDADICFAAPDWAQETLHLLQHYDVVQMFSHAQDLGPDREPLDMTPGFLYKYLENGAAPHEEDFFAERPSYGYHSIASGKFWHPGFAWAARRDALDKLGGLIDWAVLGSGDWHMATALVGTVRRSLQRGFSRRYIDLCLAWQDRAEKLIRRNVGYVPGTVLHYFHGRKAGRNYDHRWKFLVRAGFDPDLDLKRDSQGVWQLTERNIMLRDGLRAYSRMRQEDGGL